MKKGYIYGIFKVDISDDMSNVELTDSFINRNFMWLFEILNTIEGLAAEYLGIEHLFMIKIKKENEQK